MRVALDSNILIYAELEPDSGKGARAAELILRCARDGVIPVQVIGEYLRFVQRRAPSAFNDAIRQVAIYRTTFLTPSTTDEVLTAAAQLAADHGLQFWDAVICSASAQSGARVLFSEDMQDGRALGALRLVNPFADDNAVLVEDLLGNNKLSP